MNAFETDLVACTNSEKMVYARAMLRGEVPARDDIPCTTCEMYIAMRKRSQWITRAEPGAGIYARVCGVLKAIRTRLTAPGKR